MRIALIGGSGNLGSKLYLNLSKYKKVSDIVVIDYKKNLINKKKFLKINLSKDKLKKKEIKLLKKIKIDLVFILAFDINFKNERKNYFQTGKKILKNSLKISKILKVKNIIYFSSFAVYGRKRGIITERTAPTPINNYGKLKLICENSIKSFCKKNKLFFLILRISQVYGLNITSSIIGRFYNLKKENKMATIVNNGNQYRDYVYINDFIYLIKKIISFEFKRNYVVNMCRGKKTKTIDIIRMLKLKHINIENKNELKYLLGDNSLLKKTFKWSPKYNVKKGLEEMINHEKNFRN
tara:strand:+ start:615 stop:1499 length:885 start_codon:yes stop_codon:yes gene_type:complete